VKYQHLQAAVSSDDVQQSDYDETSDFGGHDDVDINQLSLDGSDNNKLNNKNNQDNVCEEEEDSNNALRKEIRHLQKRIQNITLSVQSSPLGISNPNTWRTNCLNPIKNVIKEWRSILSFHSQEITGGGSEEEEVCSDDIIESQQQQQMLQSIDNATKQTELQLLLHETSTNVFILLQMAMQTGPLVGSNPGYFKRCGGEVASVALEFLTDVICLAGAAAADDDDDDDDEEDEDHIDDGHVDIDAEKNNDNEIESPDTNVDSNSDEDSSASSSTDDDRVEGENDEPAIAASETPSAAAAAQAKELQVVQTLQSSFLFTEKQSQRLHQWHRNAQKAADSNKAPSTSASKLQGQKSKKQRMKDLKMERKLKKANKGRGRK